MDGARTNDISMCDVDKVVVVTHAGGRMGKLLVAQLRE
jgi:hypothetical protein